MMPTTGTQQEELGGLVGFILHRLLGQEPQPPQEEEEGEVRVSGWGDPLHPAALVEVVGQERLVRLLKAEAEAARREGRPLLHVLLYGAPGVGKSMLAEVTAQDAEHVVYPVSGPEWQIQVEVLQSLDRVVELHEKTRRPVAVIVDEVDGISRVASYVLHALMVRGVVFWKGHELFRGLPVYIMATCNTLARTPAALRSRFRHTLFVDYLQPAELSEVARRAAPRLGLVLADDAATFLGEHGGGEGRKVLHLLRAASTFATDGQVSLDVVRTALEISGLSAGGLDHRQADYLRFLAEQADGTAGVSTLAGYLACERREVAEAVEPFLIRSRLAQVTGRGRQITPAGRALAAGGKEGVRSDGV